MKNFERSSPSRIKLLPSETSSTLNRGTNLDKTELDNPEKSGTLRRESGWSEPFRSDRSRPIRSALGSSTLVRFTRYVPPSTCTQGRSCNNQRGVIDIIIGDVLLVVVKLRATDVVTLRCNILSDMVSRCSSRANVVFYERGFCLRFWQEF